MYLMLYAFRAISQSPASGCRAAPAPGSRRAGTLCSPETGLPRSARRGPPGAPQRGITERNCLSPRNAGPAPSGRTRSQGRPRLPGAGGTGSAGGQVLQALVCLGVGRVQADGLAVGQRCLTRPPLPRQVIAEAQVGVPERGIQARGLAGGRLGLRVTPLLVQDAGQVV